MNSVQYPPLGTNTSGDITNSGPPGFDGMMVQTETDLSTLTREQRREQRRIEAEAAIFYMMQLLTNAMIQAQADRQAWIMAGRPVSTQSATTQSMSTSEMDSGQSGATYGFYRVARNGVYVMDLTSLTNGIQSNTVSLAFEAGRSEGVLDNVIVLVDGVKCPGANVLSAETTAPWQFALDTGFLENGTHNVTIEATWENPDTSDGNNVFVSAQSAQFNLSVSNQIYYPQWEPEVGEADIAAFYLKCATPNANYQIDITDVNGNHLQTLTGQATNGLIQAYWNLVDTNGVTRNDAGVDPEFYSTTTLNAGQPNAVSKTNPKKQQRKKNWPAQGKWVIAYQDFFKYEYSEDNEMQGSINEFCWTAARYGGYIIYYPQPGQTNDIGQTYPLRYQKTNHFDTNITGYEIALDEVRLQGYLASTNSRNFYYSGHGSKSAIAGISSASLGTHIKHRYRFVFLDGCETANGDLDAAFGIHGPGMFSLQYYRNTGNRPAAFVGYMVKPEYKDGQPITVNGTRYDDSIPWQVPYFIYNFLFYWDEIYLMGWGLDDALRQARLDLPSVPGFTTQPGQGLRIHGYNTLRINEFNNRGDWP